MKTLNWTDAEQRFPRIRLMPAADGEDECPDCNSRGSHRTRNYATMSPSDDFDRTCGTCDGEGVVQIIDDRYDERPKVRPSGRPGAPDDPNNQPQGAPPHDEESPEHR